MSSRGLPSKMSISDDEYLLISGIKHFKFCRRRWALVHIEQQWDENALTVAGHLMHERVHDSGFTEKRGRLLLSRGMPIKSEALHITGVCDMVELIRDDEHGIDIHGRDGKYTVNPVEYKHGRPDTADIWQLCAQVICLEEMFVTEIQRADIYYGELHARKTYEMTRELRNELIHAVGEMHELMRRGTTPKVRPQKACAGCSMYEICQPGLSKWGSASDYVAEVLAEK